MRRSVRTGPGRAAGDERGMATVLGAFVIAGIVVVLGLVAYVGVVVSVRHSAQSGADLAALAAAGALERGADDPCARAREVAAANGVHADGCRVDGRDVVVATSASVRLGLFGMRQSHAVARAGPADQITPVG